MIAYYSYINMLMRNMRLLQKVCFKNSPRRWKLFQEEKAP